MAGIKAPIQDVLAKLATLLVTNGDGKSVNLYTRIWLNQVSHEKAGETYVYGKPAAFVEVVNDVQYSEIGGGYESADLAWRIHLVHEYYNTDTTFEQDLTIFDLRDKVITLLNHYQPTACSSMIKISEEQDYNHDNIYHYIITFGCNFIDSKGSGDDQGAYIVKPPSTGLTDNASFVPSLTPYVPDTSQFNIP